MSPLMEAKERWAKEKVLAGQPAAWVWMTVKSMPALPAHR